MNRLAPEKARAIAAEYINNGFEKVKTLLTIGYSESYSKHVGLKLFDNETVKAEIARIQTKLQVKCEITRETQLNCLTDTYDLAKVQKNPSAMVSAVREQNEMLGYHRELAPNEEKERKRLARMDLETKRMAEIKADKRLSQVAEGDKVIESVLEGDSGVVRATDGI